MLFCSTPLHNIRYGILFSRTVRHLAHSFPFLFSLHTCRLPTEEIIFHQRSTEKEVDHTRVAFHGVLRQKIRFSKPFLFETLPFLNPFVIGSITESDTVRSSFWHYCRV